MERGLRSGKNDKAALLVPFEGIPHSFSSTAATCHFNGKQSSITRLNTAQTLSCIMPRIFPCFPVWYGLHTREKWPHATDGSETRNMVEAFLAKVGNDWAWKEEEREILFIRFSAAMTSIFVSSRPPINRVEL